MLLEVKSHEFNEEKATKTKQMKQKVMKTWYVERGGLSRTLPRGNRLKKLRPFHPCILDLRRSSLWAEV